MVSDGIVNNEYGQKFKFALPSSSMKISQSEKINEREVQSGPKRLNNHNLFPKQNTTVIENKSLDCEEVNFVYLNLKVANKALF